jgi:hypothetical protein
MCAPHHGMITSLSQLQREARHEAIFAGVSIAVFALIVISGAIGVLVVALT